MLISLQSLADPARNLRRERRLWSEGDCNMLSLGCTRCPDRGVCGGLRVESPLYDCLGFCCHNPKSCDSVCRNKPDEFARRVREVGGFALDNVPRASVLAAANLPTLVPVLFHGDSRRAQFRASEAVCLPLYKVIHRQDGQTRYASPLDLAEGFGISPSLPVILTGTAFDPPLERWWSLGLQRRDVIRALRDLHIALVTTPNFSLFIDQPRWDDLHSMKRIALVHEEFLSEGLPAALHVNARTERDWDRWGDYVRRRPEVTHIAFEFATGAGWAGRVKWHADRLVKLAAVAGRPLHLVVRGGGRVLPGLMTAFSRVTLLETSAFLKTVKRQRGKLTSTGSVSWYPSPTKKAEVLDRLLTENWEVVAASYSGLFDHSGPSFLKAAG
jgi:hypothetical protein